MNLTQKDVPKLNAKPSLPVIGYIKDKNAGCNLVLRDNSSVVLKARGWGSKED